MSGTVTSIPTNHFSAGRYAPAIVWISVLGLGALVQAAGRRELTPPMIAGLALTTVTQIGLAIACFPFLGQRRSIRLAVLTVAAVLISLAPLLIPTDSRVLRFVASCASVITVMKLWDLHTHVSGGRALEWSRFMPFLCNAFAIVLRKHGEEKQPPRRQLWFDLARGIAGSALGLVAVFTLHLFPWRNTPLLVEHAVKALVIFVSILSWVTAAVAAVRLSGGTMRDFSDAPLLARTPADFWRRYNRAFQQYFYENVFKRAGGRRSPVAVTIFIFFLSGLIHEYVFGIAVGRLQGYQMSFFLLQGVAVAATLRVKPRGRMAVVAWTAATLAFNLITSLLFFLSFHALVPLYANPLPAWLQW